MSLPKSFSTTSRASDPLRDSLVKRAKKRTVRPKADPGWWAVSGSASLGDAYDSYDVRLRDDGSYWCSCEGNRGGEFRKACSHKTAVILWREKHPETDPETPVFDPDDDLEAAIEGADDSHDPEIPPQVAPGDDFSSPHDSDIDPDPSTPVLTPSPVAHMFDFDPYELDWDNPPIPQAIAGANDSPLPDKFQAFRLNQWRGIIEVVEALDNPNIKAVFVSAPTGTGKTGIGAAVPQILNTPYLYLCTTLTLQDQIERDFYYAKLIKGRSNYRTLDEPDNPDLTAEDCTMEKTKLPACPSCPGYQSGISAYTMDKTMGRHCYHCHPVDNCPYRVAKEVAASSRMAVLNTSYFLAETNHAGEGSKFAGRDLIIIDEADTLEAELMNFITVEISHGMRKRLGIGPPEKKTVADSWVEWVENVAIPACDRWLKANPPVQDLFGKPDPKTLKNRGQVSRLRTRLKELLMPPPTRWDGETEPPTDPDLASGWVMEGGYGDDGRPDESTIVFKPITVRNHAREYLWDKGGQFVLMSATIISPEQMAYDLGLEDGEWAVVEIESNFPKERRPVVVRAETTVTHKTKSTAHPILARQVAEIADAYPDYRILVHSNSYHLTKDLFFEGRRIAREGRDRYITYLNAGERAKAIERYMEKENGVLIAPSLDRGVDFHDDLARVIVIAKVPYLSLGDKQVSARLYGTGKNGKMWYAVNTIRTIVQQTGRGMRHKDDWSICYILDRQFVKLYYENRRLFPNWWKEAVVFDENDPRWRDVLKELGSS